MEYIDLEESTVYLNPNNINEAIDRIISMLSMEEDYKDKEHNAMLLEHLFDKIGFYAYKDLSGTMRILSFHGVSENFFDYLPKLSDLLEGFMLWCIDDQHWKAIYGTEAVIYVPISKSDYNTGKYYN